MTFRPFRVQLFKIRLSTGLFSGKFRTFGPETQGATPFDRDTRLTADFLQYLDQKPDKPFFAFLFYDLLHAISIPAPHRHKFEPSWEYANYMALNNEMDATPFFNLYRNCGWYVDSLVGSIVGELEHKGLLDNSILVITGDHSQEFNENKKKLLGARQ